jgi:hypothetical protein
LTTLGASGTVNGAILQQFTQKSSGSGTFSSFVRLSTSNAIEQGYNTDYRPVQFDENKTASFMHALQLSAVQKVLGQAYYAFQLDINQNSGTLLSLDELRFFVTDASTFHPTTLHNYQPPTSTARASMQDDAGRLYFPRYDLNPDSNVINYVKLNGDLSGGSGSTDMVALVPVSLLGSGS